MPINDSKFWDESLECMPREELEAKFESLSADATTNVYEFGRGIELTLINMISKALWQE